MTGKYAGGHSVRDILTARPESAPTSESQTGITNVQRRAESRSVSNDVADEVGAAYLLAKCAATDTLVMAAYKRLEVQTDHLFDALARRDAPASIRIVFTSRPWVYESDFDMIVSARKSRILEITSASVESAPKHPLLGCEFGGPFDRLRAVHDLVGHVWTGFGFGLYDEFAAWRLQDSVHTGVARLALATELLAINSARSVIGRPPPQKAVLLDVNLVARARARIVSRAWPSPSV
ncbi:MAG: hypothetical protein JWM76_4980 [Pseudonocardiales bacterium]|nr:hypothetical protein [Pseudonocardiales bacterium]